MQFDLDSADGSQEVIPSIEGRDSFGRQRMSLPRQIISLHFEQVPHDLLMNSSLTGGATITHSQTNSSIVLNCGTASGDKAIRQTKRYITYSPGIGYITTIATSMGAKKSNVRKRFGLYDELNGMFFEQDGSNLKIVTRTNSSGSAVDTAVNQSAWNLDKLDGTGASGITLDETKHQLWVIDEAWHGAGPVRFGIHYGGKIIYCHQVLAGNTLALPYTRTIVLPIRMEIENTAVAASSTSIFFAGLSVSSESGSFRLPPNYSFSASNRLTSKSVSTSYIPLISIRPKTTFGGITNRIPIILDGYDIFTAAPYLNFLVILNPTLTGASFSSVGTYSCVEFDTAASAYSGGNILTEGYTTSTTKGGVKVSDQLEEFIVGLDVTGSFADIITIVAAASNNNNATYTSIQWNEFQ